MTKTIDELISCARRETRLREAVYGRRVDRGQMAPDTADHEIDCMREITKLLEGQKRLAEPDLFGNAETSEDR